MGIVFTRLFSSLFGNREARILVLGLDNAGKTTILCESRPARLVPSPSSNHRGSAPDLRRRSREGSRILIPLRVCWFVFADRLQMGEVVSTIPSEFRL